MRAFLLIPLLLASACSDQGTIEEGLADIERSNASAPVGEELPAFRSSAQPVRIGEGGERFAACQARGVVGDAEGGLPVREAPFTTAETIDQLAAGDAVYICTRSNDQRWFGVVYGADRARDAACGVTASGIERKPYDGPCPSGWVSSAFVRLVG